MNFVQNRVVRQECAQNSVLGPHRTCYEFMIQTPAPAPHAINKMRIDDTAEPPVDWREAAHIAWTTNHSAVTFK